MNFALILFILLVISFVMWLLDVLWLKKARVAAAKVALAEFDALIRDHPGDAGQEFAAMWIA